jgi:DNA-binding transcriptional regulator YiaG
MPTLAVALKDEIRRLARKEIKAHTASTSRAVAQYRRDIAALKRHAREQAKKIAGLEKQSRKGSDAPPTSNGDLEGSRFSARSVKAQRRKTGLSAADYAKLVGVSALTIYNWEQAKSRPRKEQLASLVAVRGLGKRQALAKLESLNGSSKAANSRRNKR